MNNFSTFLNVIKSLNEKNVEYILIGGFAIIIYGMPRLTQDIDILVKNDFHNIERLKSAFLMVFNDKEINELNHNDLDKYAVIRYGTPDGFHIGIITRTGEIASYETVQYQIKYVEDVPVKIITPQSLYDLKKKSIRLEDKRDVFFLKQLLNKSK